MTENEDRGRIDPPEGREDIEMCNVCDGMGRVKTDDGYKTCDYCQGTGALLVIY